MIVGPFTPDLPIFLIDAANPRSFTQSILKEFISGNSATFSIVSPTFSPNNAGYLTFTNSVAWINSPKLAQQSTDLSVEAFVKFNNFYNTKHVIISNAELGTGQTKGFSFYWDRFTSDGLYENSLRFRFGQNSNNWNIWASPKHTFDFALERWYHLAVTCTGLNSSNPSIKFWVDKQQLGASFSTSSSKASYLTSSSAFKINSEYLSTTQSWTSSISTSMVKAYSRELTQNEISSSFEAFRSRYPKSKRYVAVGNFTSYYNMTNFLITRYLAAFDLNGILVQNYFVGFNDRVTSVAKVSGDKIIALGHFTEYRGESCSRIVRLNSDLSIDNTFSSGTGFNEVTWGLTVDTSNGSIYVVGGFTKYNGVTASRIAKLSSNGTIDTSFDAGVGFNNDAWDVRLDSSGNIIVVGDFTQYRSTSVGRIVRLLSDGQIDTTFTGQTPGFNSNVRDIHIDSNGRIWLAGAFTTYVGVTYNRFVVLNSDSTVWTGITYSTGFNQLIYNFTPLSDGGYLFLGEFTSYKGSTYNRIIKLDNLGEIDTSFSVGTGFDSYPWYAEELEDERILVCGLFTAYNGQETQKLVILNSDGSLAQSYTEYTSPGYYRDFVVLDSTIYMFGYINQLIKGATTSVGMLRFYGNGARDRSFTGVFNSFCRTFQLYDDNYLIGGGFSQYSGLTSGRLELVTATGSRIPEFNLGTGFEFGSGAQVLTTEIMTNGNILAGGLFTQFDGKPAPTLIVVSPTGSKVTPDIASFPEYGANNTGIRLKIDHKDRIYFTGLFTAYGTYSVARIARLEPDTLKVDTTFNTGTGLTIVTNNLGFLDIDRKNRLIVTGNITSYNGVTIGNICRLNEDGSLDTTFDTGTGFNSTTRGALVFDNDKILVYGSFTTYKGLTARGLVLLNDDGSVDDSMPLDSNWLFTGGGIYNARLIDGQIYLMGLFSEYNQFPVANVARINLNGLLDRNFRLGFNSTVWEIKSV